MISRIAIVVGCVPFFSLRRLMGNQFPFVGCYLRRLEEHLTFFVKNEVLSAVTLLRHNTSGFARVLSFLAFMD